MKENQKYALLQQQIDSIMSRNFNEFKNDMSSRLFAYYLPIILKEVSVQFDLFSKEEN